MTRSKTSCLALLLLFNLSCDKKDSTPTPAASTPVSANSTANAPDFDKNEIEGDAFNKPLSADFVSLLNQYDEREMKSLQDEDRLKIAQGMLTRLNERDLEKSFKRGCHLNALQFENAKCVSEREACIDAVNTNISGREADLKANQERMNGALLKQLQTALHDSLLTPDQVLYWINADQKIENALVSLDCDTPLDERKAAFLKNKSDYKGVSFYPEIEKFETALKQPLPK
jgi:hypothetical protein